MKDKKPKKSTDKKSSNSELVKYKKLAQDNLAGWQRAKADFLNYKKAQETRGQELIKYANEDLMLDIIPVLDNFEHAYNALSKDDKGASVGQGFGFIRDQLKKVLIDRGVEELSIKKGDEFDPRIMEAEKKDKKPKNSQVAKMIQVGYKLNGRVIRPAKVELD